ASGGTGSYTWSLASGTLPTGLSLSSAGVLSGTPTVAGTSSFTVQATDTASVSGTKTFSLTIAAFGALTHFTWDYVPTTANANAPFAVHLTARDASERLVATNASTVNLTAQSGSGTGSASPIVITEITDGLEDQFELQNVSSATVNTT